LDNPKEKRAAEYLQSLHGISRNKFVIEAIISYIEKQNTKVPTIDDIRSIFKEELKAVAFVTVGNVTTPSRELTEEEQAENIQNVIEDLDMFK
jgi:predicted ATP-dependent serine protease